MLRFILLVFLCVAHVSCYPRHEEEEARVLSEVWEAMDKHQGDDIIVIPRHDGPEHRGSDHRSSDHHGSSHGGPSHEESSHEGPNHEESSHEGPSHERPSHERSSDRSESERKSSDTESTSESSEKSDSSSESSDTSSTADESSSESSESSESSSESSVKSDESSRGHRRRYSGRSGEGSYDKILNKFNRLGDMMNRAVDRLRKDDREIRELENGSSSSSGGLTVFILEIVGAVVVGLILVGLLIFGFVRGFKGIMLWKARRQSERLIDQETPNMDGTGYQSGYNP